MIWRMLATQRLSRLGQLLLLRSVRLGGQMSSVPRIDEAIFDGYPRPLKAFVNHVGARGRRSYALEPGIGSSPQGEEAFSQRLILGGSRGETKTGDRPCWVDGEEQAKPLVPSQAVGPPDV